MFARTKWFAVWLSLLVATPAVYAYSAQIAITQATLAQVVETPDAGVPSATLPTSVDAEVEQAVPMLKAIFDAVTSKNWVLAAAMLVSALTFLMRWASKKWGVLPFFATDRGGVVLTFLFALAGGFANGVLVEGVKAVSPELLFNCLQVATYAIGGFVGFKKLFFPSDVK